MQEEKQVVAMYDIRGIQKYIFRTQKVKEAIGASAIVEDIIEDALRDAVDKIKKETSIRVNLSWKDDQGPKEFEMEDYDIQVLFIGGGNAFVLYENRALCLKVNRLMAYYILENTYSLQLAVAIVDKKDSYAENYRELHEQMNHVKEDMSVSGPLGTLPVMEMEIKTGYPVTEEKEGSTERQLKKRAGEEKQRRIEKELKVFDNLATQKGVDSMLAIVHIDGNNMGIRIREQIEGIEDYVEAVTRMRKISYNISNSYESVFDCMYEKFNKESGQLSEYLSKELPLCFVRKILTAGDDITYVCNAKIAMATVEYFCREIAKRTMIGEDNPESLDKYGFSVCAGIAYIGSHFPFYTGYQVAESCCDLAKEYAKEHKAGDNVGNFVDYQICKNAKVINIDQVRVNEYCTGKGEKLLRRPYYISVENGKHASDYHVVEIHQFDQLKTAVKYFQEEKNLPRSFSKTLRNIYSLGEDEVKKFQSFLRSRNWKMPDEKETEEREYYFIESDGTLTAKWYDALELLDYYVDSDRFGKTIADVVTEEKA